MSESARISLDNPVFAGRLRMPRDHEVTSTQARRQSSARFDEQVHKGLQQNSTETLLAPIWMRPLSNAPTKPVKANPVVNANVGMLPDEQLLARQHELAPALPMPAQSLTTPRNIVPGSPEEGGRKRHASFFSVLKFRPKKHGYTKLQTALVIMAALVFLLGVGISAQAFLTNKHVSTQVAALSKKASGSSSGSAPSTDKPSSYTISQYVVAPDLPRYIRIPKLGVNARVLQVGVTSSGALGTPSNVYDTAWYTGSAKPGQPGATLIDGHVSSWTTHGVFYGLKLLHPGDQIQIQRGDGQVLTYQVVKSQTYPDNKVDMQAAVTPITSGTPGLNLITCTGQVKPGTSEFNQRIIVFAKQI